MVQRSSKSDRKYQGTRRWGLGNIKNGRGKGGRGGVGRGGVKHKFTHKVVFEKDTIRKKGFPSKSNTHYKEIDIYAIAERAGAMTDAKPTLELRGYKVLSDGMLAKAVVVKASSFSKHAEEKIKKAGGEAVKV